jgi:LPXTG-site transpeptidase (sortase) family protein
MYTNMLDGESGMDYLPRDIYIRRRNARRRRSLMKKLLLAFLIVFCLTAAFYFWAKPVLWGPSIPSIGHIQVQSIGLSLDIYEGVDEEVLQIGIGHLKSSAGIGQQGNAVFSGYGLHENRFFYHLDRVEIGDEIILKNEDHPKLVYKVTAIKTVPKEEANVIETDLSENLITLVTTSKDNSEMRLMVQARLDDAGTGEGTGEGTGAGTGEGTGAGT